MKRVISMVLVVCLCLSLCVALVGCSKTGKCELCGKEAKLSKVEIGGKDGWVCAECEKGLDAVSGLANMFR